LARLAERNPSRFVKRKDRQESSIAPDVCCHGAGNENIGTDFEAGAEFPNLFDAEVSLPGEERADRRLRTELRNQISLRKVSVLYQMPHHGDWTGLRDGVTLRFITYHQQGEEFDGFLFVGSRVSKAVSLKRASVSIGLQFLVIMDNAGRSLGDHLGWVG
jgi:hypothetical protein